MNPRCPVCGEEFERNEHKKAKRARDVHVDWCLDVHEASKRLELDLPLQSYITADQRKAAVERMRSRSDNVQTRFGDSF